MLGLLTLLALGLALLWAAVVAWTAWMLTHPPRRTYAAAVARGMPGTPAELVPARAFEGWPLATPGGSLPVWEVVGDDPAGPVFVLTHGWASSRGGMLARAAGLAPLASRLILWDLPGHGEAPGRCSLGRSESEVLRSLIELVRRRWPGVPVVLYGASLGAGVSLQVAGTEPRIAAVIAEAPYRLPATPARNVLTGRGLPHRFTLGAALALVRAPWFDRAADAARVTCPVLVLHGSADVVSPVEDGRAIAGAAPRGAWAPVEGAGHNDLWTTHAAAASRAVCGFLDDQVLRNRGGNAPAHSGSGTPPTLSP